jgi:hypothetical protein
MAQNYIIFLKKLTVVRLYFFISIVLLNNQLESISNVTIVILNEGEMKELTTNKFRI